LQAKEVFQFQFGTIDSSQLSHLYQSVPKFQFQFGTIDSLVKTLKTLSILRFNSSLVRLIVYQQRWP